MKKWNPTNIGLGITGLLTGFSLLLRSRSDMPLVDLKIIGQRVKHTVLEKKLGISDMATSVDVWDYACVNNQKKVFLTFINDAGEMEDYTYGQVDHLANQVANWLLAKGVGHKDCVALVMENKPELVFLQIACAKVGAILALINYTQRGIPLLHSVKVCNAKVIICGSENIDGLNELISDHMDDEELLKQFYVFGGAAHGYGESIDDQINSKSTVLHHSLPPVNRCSGDTYLYIYTSGTTGHPKASIISHKKYFGTSFLSMALDVTEKDSYYTSLPLYHSAGNMLGLGSVIVRQARLVFRRKFSASNFWRDCYESQATVIQYIGELCRYLLSCPPTEYDKIHDIRLAIGNGLRPDIWLEFQERFNIKQIGEFYGSTEGNANLLNMVNKPGSVGYFPMLFEMSHKSKIIRYDMETDEHIKDKNGFNIPCKPGEVGELVGEIDENSRFTAPFEGYTNAKATQGKIMHDVFVKGDKYFRTGDLLYKDPQGFYFFVDRIGDTFRWKGENVSTSEVEVVLNTYPGIDEINVYGASVPNHDGRAGMGAIITNSSFDMKEFYEFAMSELASYAAPLFLRLREDLVITGTFKHIKTHLRNEGIDPSTISDPIYVRNDTLRTFIRFTPSLYEQIQKSTIPIEKLTPPSL